ncbi:MAG: GGDEF domain-containing protein [Sideroxydans sp.]|nr:GGDEF domain-containing protein [Sideroxydans sp.]
MMLHTYIYSGTHGQLEPTERRKTFYANVGSLIALSTLLVVTLSNLFTGSEVMRQVVYVQAPFAVLFMMTAWMNHRGWRNTARWNLMLSCHLVVLIPIITPLGNSLLSQIYFLLIAVISVTFFHAKQRLSILFLFSLNMGMFLYVEAGHIPAVAEMGMLDIEDVYALRFGNVVTAIAAYMAYVWMIEVVAEHSERELELQAVTDALTQLPNRRYFDLAFQQEVAKVSRKESVMVLAMLDIDHFKNINDSYGHDVGDQVLRHIALLLRTSTRAGNVIARVGGEEFSVLFPATTLIEAQEAAERIRETIENAAYQYQGESLKLTVSIGLAEVAKNQLAPQSYKLADEALYAAKHMGRNRVVAFEA